MQTHKFLKITFLAIFSFALALISGCKPAPKPVTEEEAYALLNEIILDDSLVIDDVYYKFYGFALSDEMKKEFTNEEVEFMEKQISELKTTKIKPNKIVYFHRGYKPGTFVKLEKGKGEFFTAYISFPIISPDRKKLLIHFTVGQSGSDDLYIKKNGRWRLTKSFNAWIA
jgi:hypothetical protein